MNLECPSRLLSDALRTREGEEEGADRRALAKGQRRTMPVVGQMISLKWDSFDA